MSQPLYGAAPSRGTGPLGVWRAVVVDLEPLTVRIPGLTGTEDVPDCESAVFDPALTVGDRVWVATVEGNPELWALIARRA